MDRLKGKVAVVTGAANGMGLATTKLFLEEGAKVVMCDLDAKTGEAEANKLDGAIFVKLNVSQEENWKEVFSKALDTFKKVDIVVNCAGIPHNDNCEDITMDAWEKVLGVDLTGVMLGTKYGTLNMKDHGGSIINFSSDAGIVGCPENLAYCAAKGGVITLSKSAALHNCSAKNGVRVNAVVPGVTNTKLITEGSAGGLELWGSYEPIGRVAEPREIAQAVLFLASDESSFVTGSALVVDGGYAAQ